MLTPSELRKRAENYRLPYGSGGPWNQEHADIISDLCEQVAALREERARDALCDQITANPERYSPKDYKLPTGNPVVSIRPAPRILKAGEITEPGWYFRRDVGQDGDYYDPVDIRMYPCNAPHDEQSLHFYGQHVGKWLPLQLQIESEQFYGPIQLPE